MSNAVTPISKRELLAYQADVKGAIFRQIRETFSRLKQSGFTQKDLAVKIGMNEGQLSRRLRGDYDLRLETLSDLARGLDCRIDVRLVPLSSSTFLAPDRMLELVGELEAQLREVRAMVEKNNLVAAVAGDTKE